MPSTESTWLSFNPDQSSAPTDAMDSGFPQTAYVLLSKIIWDDSKTHSLLCQYIIKKKKETKPKKHSCSNCWLLKTVPILWTCFAFYHLLEEIKEKGLSKSPLTSTTHNQTLTLASTYKHIFSVSLCSGSVENYFIIGWVWLTFRDKTRWFTKNAKLLKQAISISPLLRGSAVL